MLVISTVLVIACVSSHQSTAPDELSASAQDRAQLLVDSAIIAHGGALYDSSYVEFVFRNRRYVRERKGGTFTYERIFTNPKDSSQQVRDILTNNNFRREINGERVALHDTLSFAYTNSVNSVIYFALIPYRLNDPAVNKKYLGQTVLKGEPYHQIQITFDEKGGGKDFEDVFIYWIHAKTYHIDYLAYSYEVDGGGIRFREAINPRSVKGIRFQDYINYEVPLKYDLIKADSLFSLNKLDTLSEILLENIAVRYSTQTASTER